MIRNTAELRELPQELRRVERLYGRDLGKLGAREMALVAPYPRTKVPDSHHRTGRSPAVTIAQGVSLSHARNAVHFATVAHAGGA